MNKFSERIGITKPPEIQLNGVNQALRISLWNIILLYLEAYYRTPQDLEQLCTSLALHVFKIPLNEIRGLGYTNFGDFSKRLIEDWIKEEFDRLQWYRVYEFIEFLVQNKKGFNEEKFQENLNHFLKKENSGYRLVNGKFVPITSEQEVKAIEEAIEKATKVGIEGAREHLSSALSLLAQKPVPDYRNSIKESISAVESVVKQISGERGGGLDKALEELSKKAEIHGALKQGFLKLYGYTSDEDGIRHAILEDPNVGFDEAKFMLVSCSAFVNFLFSKAQKAGLLKEG